MKLTKPLQIAIGFAATSGMVGLLSGNALAADNSVVTTAQSAVQTSTQISPQITKIAEESDQNPTFKTTAIPSDEVRRSADSEQVKTPHHKIVSSDNPDQLPVDSATEPASTTVAKDNRILQSSDQAVPANANPALTPAVEEVSSIPVTPPPVLPSVDKTVNVRLSASQQAAANTFPTAKLVIQPTITNRAPAPVVDLASLVPTAQMPVKHHPVPAETSGLLSRLTAGLAATAMPHLVSFTLPAIWNSGSATGFMVTLIVIFTSLVAVSFGQWLRQAGLVSAARSDLPNLSTSFATPHQLGYVPALPRLHSPLFMVSETNPGQTFGSTTNFLQKGDIA